MSVSAMSTALCEHLDFLSPIQKRISCLQINDHGSYWSSVLQYQSCWMPNQYMPNKGLFGLLVHHVIRSESVWNSSGLCSSSSSSSNSSTSRSSSSSSSSSESSISSSQYLVFAYSGLKFFSQQGQDRGRVPGRSAGQEGISWVLIECLWS